MASTASTVHAIASSSGKGFIVSRKMTMARPAIPIDATAALEALRQWSDRLTIRAKSISGLGGRTNVGRAARFVLSAYAGRPGDRGLGEVVVVRL